MKTLTEHLSSDNSNGPKRILSLDGGGIRGAFTLGYLEKLEQILRDKSGNQKMLLCDHFDLIGGTSTGSIIAAALAIGMEVKDIIKAYKSLGGKIFGEKHSWWNIFEVGAYLKGRYNHKALEQELQNVFGQKTLGSGDIKTGLCIVAKRADTNSIWPIINHPAGKFYDSPHGRNKNILLWQAVRASCSAPTYFAPVVIDVGDGIKGAFVDGGLSTANNPALNLLMVATLKGFPFHWEFGEDKLELYSFGTGYQIFKKITSEIEDSKLWNWAANAPDMLMQDSSWLNQIMLQWMSDSPTAQYIDMEMEYLKNDHLCGSPRLRYLRFNYAFTSNNLTALLGRPVNEEEVADLLEMSNAKNVDILIEIGRKRAEEELKAEFVKI